MYLVFNFISLLTTHCVYFSYHQVLSHQRPIWSETRVKTRKMLIHHLALQIFQFLQLFKLIEDTPLSAVADAAAKETRNDAPPYTLAHCLGWSSFEFPS